jgi:hypothetical protein
MSVHSHFPLNFPNELGEAFIADFGEVAWGLEDVRVALEWLGANGIAVLGIELWVIQGRHVELRTFGPDGKRFIFVSAVEPKDGEAWTNFVDRSVAETIVALGKFDRSWVANPGEIYFNVVWANETEFARTGQ